MTSRPAGAVLACLGLAAVFVGSLYVAPARIRALPHDDPRQIRQRATALACVCVAAVAFAWWWCGGDGGGGGGLSAAELLGLRAEGFLPALVLPLGLTVVLFQGALLHKAWEHAEYQLSLIHI